MDMNPTCANPRRVLLRQSRAGVSPASVGKDDESPAPGRSAGRWDACPTLGFIGGGNKIILITLAMACLAQMNTQSEPRDARGAQFIGFKSFSTFSRTRGEQPDEVV